MTSGKIMPKTTITTISVLFFLLSLTVNNVYAEQSPEALENLLKPFQKINQIKLAYYEERSSLFLKKPKMSKGHIEYSKPDRFIKTIEPSKTSTSHQTFIIEANQLSIEQFDTKTSEKCSIRFITISTRWSLVHRTTLMFLRGLWP